jgi:hypothetical protein
VGIGGVLGGGGGALGAAAAERGPGKIRERAEGEEVGQRLMAVLDATRR